MVAAPGLLMLWACLAARTTMARFAWRRTKSARDGGTPGGKEAEHEEIVLTSPSGSSSAMPLASLAGAPRAVQPGAPRAHESREDACHSGGVTRPTSESVPSAAPPRHAHHRAAAASVAQNDPSDRRSRAPVERRSLAERYSLSGGRLRTITALGSLKMPNALGVLRQSTAARSRRDTVQRSESVAVRPGFHGHFYQVIAAAWRWSALIAADSRRLPLICVCSSQEERPVRGANYFEPSERAQIACVVCLYNEEAYEL